MGDLEWVDSQNRGEMCFDISLGILFVVSTFTLLSFAEKIDFSSPVTTFEYVLILLSVIGVIRTRLVDEFGGRRFLDVGLTVTTVATFGTGLVSLITRSLGTWIGVPVLPEFFFVKVLVAGLIVILSIYFFFVMFGLVLLFSRIIES